MKPRVGIQRWAEVRATFDELVLLDEGERRAHLERLSGSDPDLHAAVDALLAADSQVEKRLAAFEAASLFPRVLGPDPLGLAGRLVSHFRLREAIGAGGMGVVYSAEDEHLGRSVALKFLLPGYSLDADAKARFLREGRSAAALDHPNLCSIHEVGESEDGRLFLAMALYSGETLKTRLERNGPLPVREALEIARQIAEGLASAHAVGIVHRDLKPGNVMLLPDGTVKILDFGLAKARDQSLSEAGSRFGTVSYMAPEQIWNNAVDGRADLWALGVVIYEMITGRKPFGGEEQIAVAHAVLHDEPEPPSTFLAELPTPVEDLLSTLLQKDPAARYSTARTLLDELEQVVAALEANVPPARKRPRPGPRVRAGARWRMTAIALALLIGALGYAVFSPPRENHATRAAERRAMSTDDALVLTQRPTENTEAYLFYLQARDYGTRPGDVRKSTEIQQHLYEQAIALDPRFALARAELSTVHAWMYWWRYDRTPGRALRARAEAAEALRLAPDLPEAHIAMGYVHYWVGREYDRALEEFAIGLRGLPNDVGVWIGIAAVQRRLGNWDKVLEAFDHGMRLAPRNAGLFYDVGGGTYRILHRYSEAVGALDRALTIAPDAYKAAVWKGLVYVIWQGQLDTLRAVLNVLPTEADLGGDGTRTAQQAQLLLWERNADSLLKLVSAAVIFEGKEFLVPSSLYAAWAHQLRGDTSAARAAFDSSRVLLDSLNNVLPDDWRVHGAMGLAAAGLGRRPNALREARWLERSSVYREDAFEGPMAAEVRALILAQAGEADAALDEIERLLASHSWLLSVHTLRLDPRWDSIRAHPRFQGLLAKHRT